MPIRHHMRILLLVHTLTLIQFLMELHMGAAPYGMKSQDGISLSVDLVIHSSVDGDEATIHIMVDGDGRLSFLRWMYRNPYL